MGYNPSTVGRHLNGSLPLSTSAAKRYDEVFPGATGRPGFEQLRRILREAEARERGEMSWTPPELAGGQVHGPYFSADDLYTAAREVLVGVVPHSEDRQLCLSSLYGHSGHRLNEPTPGEADGASKVAFDHALDDVIAGRDCGVFRVRHLVTVPTPHQLDHVLTRMERYAQAPSLEVRAYQAPLSIPTFAPLIFANTETFLALEDHRYYRVSSGLHISGRATARWATAYFDRLWADAPFKLRTPVGVNAEAVQALRHSLGK